MNENFNWKNSIDLIKWIEIEIHSAEKELDEFITKDTKKDEIFPLYALLIAGKKVEYPIIKKLSNEEIENLSFLYQTNENIYLIHLLEIIKLIAEVDFFYKSKISIDGTRYKSEINRLKNNADELQKFSESQIIIKLPILPHESIAFTVENLKRYGLNNDEIKSLLNSFEIFKTRDKLPKITKALENRELKRFTNNLKESANLREEYKDILSMKLNSLDYTNKRQGEYFKKNLEVLKKVHFDIYYYKAKKVNS